MILYVANIIINIANNFLKKILYKFFFKCEVKMPVNIIDGNVPSPKNIIKKKLFDIDPNPIVQIMVLYISPHGI